MTFCRVFSQILNSFIGKFQVCTVLHTWLLIYLPLSQTTLNNNNEDLDKEVEDCRRRLLKYPSWRLICSRCQLLDVLSNALYNRFQQLGGIEYLEESITCWRQGLDLCPIGDPNRLFIFDNFASGPVPWATLFQQLGRMEDLEEAITCHRQALALLPDGHPGRSFSLNNPAIAVSTRFQQLGRTVDLEEVITCRRQALTLFPHGHSDSLNNLTSALFNSNLEEWMI
jgi:tetratricopeptide (TPR) repeat protein